MNKNVWVCNENEFPLLYKETQHSNEDQAYMNSEEWALQTIKLSEKTLGYRHALQFALMQVPLSDQLTRG